MAGNIQTQALTRTEVNSNKRRLGAVPNVTETFISISKLHGRSLSMERDQIKTYKSKYLVLLLEILQRTVTDIYDAINEFNNLKECDEVIATLTRYVEDFRELRERDVAVEVVKQENATKQIDETGNDQSIFYDSSIIHVIERIDPDTLSELNKSVPNFEIEQTDASDKCDAQTEAINEVTVCESQSSEVAGTEKDVQSEREVQTEHSMCPSDDQLFYKDVIKRIVESSEAGTDTSDLNMIKSDVIKSDNFSQTDEENGENEKVEISTSNKNSTIPLTTVKIDAKDSKSTSTISKPTTNQTVKPSLKSPTIKSPTETSVKKPAQLTKRVVQAKVDSKLSPRVELKPRIAPVLKRPYATAVRENKERIVKSSTQNSPPLLKERSKTVSTFGQSKARVGVGLRPGLNVAGRPNGRVVEKDASKSIVVKSSPGVELTTKIEEVKAKPLNVDGWLEVKSKFRFRKNEKKNFWTDRFNKVGVTTSLPTLSELVATNNSNHGWKADVKVDDLNRSKKAQSVPPDVDSSKATPKSVQSTVPAKTKSEQCLTRAKSDLKKEATKKNERVKLHKSKTCHTFVVRRREKSFIKEERVREKSEKEVKKNGRKVSEKVSEKTNEKVDDKVDEKVFDAKSSSVKLQQNQVKRKSANSSVGSSPSPDKESYSDKEREENRQYDYEHARKSQQLNDEEEMLTHEIAALQRCTDDLEADNETDGDLTDDEMMTVDLHLDKDRLSKDRETTNPEKPTNPLRFTFRVSTTTETLTRYQSKQAKALQRREQLQKERSDRLQTLFARVDDVRTAKIQLTEEKRQRMEDRLQRAELNRNEHLKSVVRKAHDEEEKLREIAFIKELQEQHKRHDFMALCREQEDRLQDLKDGQRKKLEEQAARGAAAEERRKILEKERFERLERMQAEKQKRAERIGMRQQERQEQARERALVREEKISAIHAQQLASAKELEERISRKQEESARRHEENIELIRQKALVHSILRSYNEEPVTPAITPYDAQKMCTICNVKIRSEVYLFSHLRGRSHKEALRLITGDQAKSDEMQKLEVENIVDAPADTAAAKLTAERNKMLKNKCKKIKQRMQARAAKYESELIAPTINPGSWKVSQKSHGKLESFLKSGAWSYDKNNNTYNQLDRLLNNETRLLQKQLADDFTAFRVAGWFSSLAKLLTLDNSLLSLPSQSLICACNLWKIACFGRPGFENSQYAIYSNKIVSILDSLNLKLAGLADDTKLPSDPLATALMQVLEIVLDNLPSDISVVTVQDLVSYAVSIGIVEQLSQCCNSVRSAVHNDPPACQFLLAALRLLTVFAKICGPLRYEGNTLKDANDKGTKPRPNQTLDPAHFMAAALQSTELVGVVSMLYGILLPTGISPRCEQKAPEPMPAPCFEIAMAVCKLLRQVARLDLTRFQEALGAEGVSLQFRHIAGHLMWSCAVFDKDRPRERELLHEVISVTGYFAVKNSDNQMLLISGYSPSVLQQMRDLPFSYFSDPYLKNILMPTLLACCYKNPETTKVLQKEVSYQALIKYAQTEDGMKNPLILLCVDEVKQNGRN